ncbi:MAG: glycosyltransferase family 39 protein [Desulfobacteraceae bacterium]|nr:glycosyltransferase family 39 protein [Desulfobacteraceae bacterium]
MKSDSTYTGFSFLTIFVFLAFRLFYIATTPYDLIADEAYFWDWSRHPDLSYYDMGPMVAWIIRFFTSLVTTSEFSVRMAAPIFSCMTAVVFYKLVSEIQDSKKLTFYTILLFHVTPIATAGGVIITYYTPQFFFMTVTAFFMWRLIKENKGFWWYLIGLSTGLGFLSHHLFAVFSAEIVLFILLSPHQRKWLFRKEPYLGLAIELLVASPVFIWNMTHQAVMAKHAIGLMGGGNPFQLFGDFLAGQAAIQTPLLFAAVLYGLWVSGYRGLKHKEDLHLLLFCLSAPLLLFIALLSLAGRTEANWPVSAYVTGSIAAVMAINGLYDHGTRLRKRLITGGICFTLSLGVFTMCIATYPGLLSVFGVSLPPRLDPANRLYGWEEMGKEVSAQLASLPGDSFISARDYGMAALLAFYVEGRPKVYAIPDGRRMSQYDFWNGGLSVKGKDALFVDLRKMRPKTQVFFNRIELAKKLMITTDDGGAVRKNIYIYKCYGYKEASENPTSY